MWNIGICTVFNDFKRLAALKEAGADFFEFGFSSIGTADESLVNESVAFVKELGLPVVSMNGLLIGDFRMTGENTNHDYIAEFVDKTLERATKFGTKNYVIGSGKARSVPEGFSEAKAREQLESLFVDKLLPIFKKHDCYLSIEELRKEECNIFVTCREAMETIRKIDHPNLTLLVDYYHAMLGGDTYEEIASYKGKITHVHIASPKHERHVPMPNDGEDYQGFFDALRKAEYKQMNISLEGGYGGKDPVEVARQSFAYLRTFK